MAKLRVSSMSVWDGGCFADFWNSDTPIGVVGAVAVCMCFPWQRTEWGCVSGAGRERGVHTQRHPCMDAFTHFLGWVSFGFLRYWCQIDYFTSFFFFYKKLFGLAWSSTFRVVVSICINANFLCHPHECRWSSDHVRLWCLLCLFRSTRGQILRLTAQAYKWHRNLRSDSVQYIPVIYPTLLMSPRLFPHLGKGRSWRGVTSTHTLYIMYSNHVTFSIFSLIHVTYMCSKFLFWSVRLLISEFLAAMQQQKGPVQIN